MPWTTSINELRDLIADNATDKPRYRKRLLGIVDGSNKIFKTFERRRLTNFLTNTDSRLGVFINNTLVSVTSDDPLLGECTLTSSPAVNSIVEASYYIQWFQDSELTNFLTQAAEWLGFANATQIPPGLRPASKYLAAQECYHRLALWWAEHLSEHFRLEDAPNDNMRTPVDIYRQMAMDANKKAVELRDHYYSGKGTEKQARSTTIAGRVSKIVPIR